MTSKKNVTHQECRIPVIYILGVAHSGTTLTDLLLGSHSHIESLGEVHKYWWFCSRHSPRLAKKCRCTCGELISNCAFWNGVRQQLEEIAGSDEVDLEARDTATFEAANRDLFRAAAKYTGKSVICDSSKWSGRLRRLLGSDAFDVHIVHLVRDGRAVASSYRKRGKFAFGAALRWQAVNLTWRYFSLLRRKAASYCLIRYEDLVADPEGNLKQIMGPLGLAFEPEQIQYREPAHHNISGNAMKIDPERTHIQLDTQYLSDLSPWQWWSYTLGATPGLTFLRYPWRRRVT